MASLVKPWCVRYKLRGKHVPKGTPGAVKTLSRTKKWYGQGIPGMKGKRVPLSTHRGDAQRMLAELVRRAESGRGGLPADEPLGPLLEEWSETIGGEPTHRRECLNHARAVLSACAVGSVAHLRVRGLASRVESFVRSLCGGDSPVAGRTAAAYGLHARQFTRWLWRKKELLDSDPLAGVDLPSQAPRTPRRDLTPEELAMLLDAARVSRVRVKKLDGPSRACLYLTAAATGYRAGELAAIEKADLHLEDDPPTVRLSGEHTKNGRDACQPIPAAVAAVLKAHTAGIRATARVWPGSWYTKAADMLRVDLAAAGLQARTARGEAVFHSIRHSYASMLVLVAPASVAHELARHGDVATTLKHYAHASDAAKLAAVNAMPLPGSLSPAGGGGRLTREQVENLAVGFWVVLATLLGGERR